ncbi:MAG TPA: hypothetical protein VMU59_09410 [Caulobacteraceae bacterium]|nr:hypothetical protein [Caulobacteraceae bacterium]
MDIESLSRQVTPLQRARAKLKPPKAPDRTLGAVAAAAFFAVSALTFAAAAILAPPVTIEPISTR